MSERARSFWGWGFVDRFPDEAARQALAAQVGMLLGGAPITPRPLPDLSAIEVPAPRVLPPPALAGMASTDRGDRALHTYGRGYPDLLRGFRGDFAPAPDWIAYPADEDEVAAVLAHCAAERVAVIPYGGGTSVVGGVEGAVGDGYRGVVSLDLRKLDRVLEVDAVSRAARIQAGARGPAIQEGLAPHGFVLRHYPQSFEFSTLGGWIATRAGGHYATLYTHIDDFVQAVRMVTPSGMLETRRLPASGAGPSPERLVLGSEGILGVIVDAWVRVQHRPTYRASASITFPSFAQGARAARAIAQAGLHPANCRLLDKTDALLGGVFVDGDAVLLLAFESDDHPLTTWMERALALAGEEGGRCPEGPVYKDDRGKSASEVYKRSFFDAPYRQSALVTMGVIADTFETACTWDRFEALDRMVREAVTDAMARVAGGGVLGCRFTHVYPDGAAPYYTFVARGREGEELAQWSAIKEAASRALLAAGGTITHHHAVGRLHRPYWEDERPATFAAALVAVKRALDPAGIMNPGVLVEPLSS
jgi:alkyldihydroxyacetonephosphate synthase